MPISVPSIFERPALPQATGHDVGRRLRDAHRRHSDDPAVAAYRTHTALGGAAAFGFYGGGGGGDGGGDGGGGG